MDFYLKCGADCVIVYASDQQLQLLFSGDAIFVDGTSSTAPNGFNQVFSIHVQKFGQGERLVFYQIVNIYWVRDTRTHHHIRSFQKIIDDLNNILAFEL
jgi:hypothetical protein